MMTADIIFIFLVLLGMHMVAKRAISLLVFPAQFKKVEPLNIDELQDYNPELSIQTENIILANNRELYAIIIEPKKDIKGTIVIFNGQNAVINDPRKLKIFFKMASDVEYRVIGFNYSGTGKKKITTWSEKSLIADIEKLVEHFKTNKKENLFPIIFKGNSLGGAVAKAGAKKFHRNKIPVYLWNGRSFTSVAAVLAGYIETLTISGHYSHKITIKLANFFKPILDYIFSFYNWGMHAGDAYLEIPDPFKHYYIVHSSEEEKKYKKDDVIIPYSASLAANLKVQQQVNNFLSPEIDEDTPETLAYYWRRSKVSWHKSSNAHGAPETELFSEDNISSYQMFCLFATQYVPRHWQQYNNENDNSENCQHVCR
jgi:hypothetical protein